MYVGTYVQVFCIRIPEVVSLVWGGEIIHMQGRQGHTTTGGTTGTGVITDL